MTGLRHGELCGLMWRDLEPDLATLAVRRQRVVDDPGQSGAGETAQIPQRRPQSGAGPDDRGHPDQTRPRTKAARVSGYMFTGR